jgi:hypothetical protein
MLMYYNFTANSGYNGAVNTITAQPFKAYYSFYYFGQLYALGNRVECASDTKKLYAMAATDGNKKAIVLCNHSSEPQTVKVSGAEGNATVYMTDETHVFDAIEADIDEIKLDAFAIALIEI